MCMSKLSVIVPIFNGEKYLNKCIQSILKQKKESMEIILVDDGSTDGSLDICKEFEDKDNRIKVIHQENLGPIQARRNGLLASMGSYVTFVDADDWIDENTYSTLEDEMLNGTDLILFGKVVEKEGSGVTYLDSSYTEGMYDRNQIVQILKTAIWDNNKKHPGITQSLYDKIFKRELLLKSYEMAKDVPKIHHGEDPLILFPILQWIDSLYITNQVFYHYRQRIGEIPRYIRDKDFFKNAFIWFSYLRDNVQGIPDGLVQLEYVYLHLLEQRKEIYGDCVKNDEYMFPFNKVPMNSSIVLYGAGRVGATYYDQLTRIHYCQIVAWIDKNSDKYIQGDVLSSACIVDLEFDYVVIAVQSDDIRNEIRNWIISLGIEENKII